jgi:3-hydroxyisobutyrate dehydrogenase
VRLIDAPISGGALRAEVGSLAIIMGGEDDDIDFARPVMESLGTQLFHCGPVGAAQTVKIINNILGIASTHFAAEAYRLALDHGLSVTDTAAVLEASTGRNYLSENAGEAAASFAKWAGTRREFDSLRSIMLKDLGIALELTSASQGSYPATERLMSLVGSLGDETFENWCTVGAAPAE